MLQRILSILGWIGTALVLAAVAIRVLRPEWDTYAGWAAWAGLGLVVLYTLGQWREIAAYFKQRNARYGAIASVGVLVFLGHRLDVPAERSVWQRFDVVDRARAQHGVTVTHIVSEPAVLPQAELSPSGDPLDAIPDNSSNAHRITRAEVEAALTDWCASHGDAPLCRNMHAQ